jgi:hypothetical protein
MISPKPIDLTELTTEELAERQENLRLRVNVKLDLYRDALDQHKAALSLYRDSEKEEANRVKLRKVRAKARKLSREGHGEVCLDSSYGIWVGSPEGLAGEDAYEDDHCTEAGHQGDTAEQCRAWEEAVDRLLTYKEARKNYLPPRKKHGHPGMNATHPTLAPFKPKFN